MTAVHMVHVHTCALHTVDLLSLSISMTLNSFESIQSNHFYPIMLHQSNARPHRSMSIHMCMFPRIYILPSNLIHLWSRSGRCCPGNMFVSVAKMSLHTTDTAQLFNCSLMRFFYVFNRLTWILTPWRWMAMSIVRHHHRMAQCWR